MAPPPTSGNLRQKQPITTTLRNICETYSTNTCLRELLQNADDAKATEIEYVLDTKTYTNEPLIDPQLGQFQGPALLARNNSVFTKKDFESLSSVGDSGKRLDPATTGKFGQGFNSVYHWTDGPWVYSGSTLLLLDPHELWSAAFQAGGPTWDVVENAENEELRNHLATFSRFTFDHRKNVDQTFIRVPLRTKAQAAWSKIVPKEATISDIQNAFENFKRDIHGGDLLYLKHIRKVILRIDDTIISTAEILDHSIPDQQIRSELPAEFLQMYASPNSQGSRQLVRTCNTCIQYTDQANAWTDEYLVTHLMKNSTGDKKLDIWGRKIKLFPWVAIAAPLKHKGPVFKGRLFTTLSLRIETHQPVHIHGLFAIAPDRARLNPDDTAIKWNQFMFKECVANAWVALLEYRNLASPSMEKFGFWPSTDLRHSETDVWTSMDLFVIDIAIVENKQVWNSTNQACVSFQEALFKLRSLGTSLYEASWIAVGLPGVLLDQQLHEMVQRRAAFHSKTPRLVTPASVRRHLHGQVSIPKDSAAALLECCLLDAIDGRQNDRVIKAVCSDLCFIRFWPLLDGSLGRALDSSLMLLPRDKEEMQLFYSSRPEVTLNIDDLTPKVREFMLDTIVKARMIARFRTLKDLELDWPNMYNVDAQPDTSLILTARDKTLDPILQNTWLWMCKQLKEENHIVPSAITSLWILPLREGRLRRLTTAASSVPALMIDQKDSLHDILLDSTLKFDPLEALVVDNNALGKNVADEIRPLTTRIPSLGITTQDNIVKMISWLANATSLLQATTDGNKTRILGHLSRLAKNSQQQYLSPSTMSQLRQLPLYSKIVTAAPFTRRSIEKASIVTHGDSCEIPQGLPLLPEIKNLSLYDLSKSGEHDLVKSLSLLSQPSTEALLGRYLLPWLTEDLEPSFQGMKLALIDWIFRRSLAPTQTWKLLVSSQPIVPLQRRDDTQKFASLRDLIDPESQLAMLYYDEEDVFPSKSFFKKHQLAARACGIRNRAAVSVLLVDRAKMYMRQPADETLVQKVTIMLALPLRDEIAGDVIQNIRRMEWLPARSPNDGLRLYAPNNCRSFDQSHLVDKVWGTTRLAMAPGWSNLFGWDQKIPQDILLKQLDHCVGIRDPYRVDGLLSYFQAQHPQGLVKLVEVACVLGAHGTYMLPGKVYSPGNALRSASLLPYLDRISSTFATKHKKLLLTIGTKAEPSVEDLQAVHSALQLSETGKLSNEGLEIAVATLEAAVHLGYDSKHFMIPDSTAVFRDMKDIVQGESHVTGQMAAFNFSHPKLSPELLRKLEVETCIERAVRLDMAIEDEDEDEYTPREKLSDIICDTLSRYPVETTFGEFLANADDAGATRISWTIDDRDDHASDRLLTPELTELQGPALIVYNDSIFTEKDFAGFREIGRGGKQEDPDTTGMFGRGAMTMYHFTDVPMLISAGHFVIIDPQQERLPRNSKSRKRKTGIKVPLSTIRKGAGDSLSPFDGIHGFDKEMDYYEGTIFRFPLRRYGCTTDLRDSAAHLDQNTISGLLDQYLTVARSSLLFLRTIKTIEFYFHGIKQPKWSVSCFRPEGSEAEVFRNIIISTQQGSQGVEYDLWRVGRKDIDSSPADLPKIGKGISKITECGIAACVQYDQTDRPNYEGQPTHGSHSTRREKLAQHRVFCMLPVDTPFNLPVSIHASFAITGDRKTIAFENDTRVAKWNEWLLSNCLAAFYVDFLRDCARRYGPAAFQFWPQRPTGRTKSLSTVVSNAFWTEILSDGRRFDELYPLTVAPQSVNQTKSTSLKRPMGRERRTLYRVSSLERAQFDLLDSSESNTLRPLCERLSLDLVKPPHHLWKDLQTAVLDLGLVKLGPELLAKVFQAEQNCRILEQYVGDMGNDDSRVQFYTIFLDVLVPKADKDSTEPLHILHGCRVIPRPQLTLPLGMLEMNPKIDTRSHLLATVTEQKLFDFAADRMVHTRLVKANPSAALFGRAPMRDVLSEICNSPCNIRKINLKDIGDILARSDSPIKNAAWGPQHDKWMIKLWEYLNFRPADIQRKSTAKGNNSATSVGDFLDMAQIWHHPMYKVLNSKPGHYVSPRDFEDGPFIVEPDDEEGKKLASQIQGLKIVDRRLLPSLLEENENNLKQPLSFARFVRAIKRTLNSSMDGITKSLHARLGEKDRTVLRGLLDVYLTTFPSPDKVADLPVLKCLPVWPHFTHGPHPVSMNFLSASNAIFCEHGEMLVPWLRDLIWFVVPDIVSSHSRSLSKLGVKTLSVKDVWSRIELELPTALPTTELRRYYLRVLRKLSENGIKSSARIALDTEGVLHYTNSLYDHENHIFSSAFEHEKEKRFLHPDFRALRTFFARNGLRARQNGRIDSGDFLECVDAVVKQWTHGPASAWYNQSASAVTAYLDYDQPDLHHWHSSTWNRIARAPIFKIDRALTDQPGYRQAKMHAVAGDNTHASLQSAAHKNHVRVCWSQVSVLSEPPNPFVLTRLERGGVPALEKVFQHLQFLIGQHSQISDSDLSEYLKDVQACYDHLQSDARTKDLPQILSLKIWFNLDSTATDRISKSQLAENLLPACVLCLQAPCDTPSMIRTKKFLAPYDSLLTALGCPAFSQPPPLPPRAITTDETSSLGARMKEFRKQRQLIDVYIEAEGVRQPAHKVVLAAVSGFCQKQFTGVWGDNLDHQAVLQFRIGESKQSTLSTIIDFAYGVDFAGPLLQDPEDQEEIATKLDEILDVLVCADGWEILRLRDQVEDFLTETANASIYRRADNVVELKKIAVDANASRLVTDCEEYIRRNQKGIDRLNKA